MSSPRRALMTSLGLIVLRRRLQRRGGPGAALALIGLELVGPRLFDGRRLLVLLLALTIVGGIAVAAIWWWRRGSSRGHATEAAAPAGATPEPEPA